MPQRLLRARHFPFRKDLPMTDIAAQKAAARTAAFAARKGAHAAVDPRPAMTALLAEIRRLGPQGPISGYAPIRTEIDPTPVMTALCEAGAEICLPVVAGPRQPLIFRRWTPEMTLVPGAFGAPVPPDGPEVEPVCLIAPLLAFDRARYRLGYGGGFYDRTLAALRARRRTVAIGLAYAAQEVARVPVEPTDEPLDGIVTEKEVIRPVA